MTWWLTFKLRRRELFKVNDKGKFFGSIYNEDFWWDFYILKFPNPILYEFMLFAIISESLSEDIHLFPLIMMMHHLFYQKVLFYHLFYWKIQPYRKVWNMTEGRVGIWLCQQARFQWRLMGTFLRSIYLFLLRIGSRFCIEGPQDHLQTWRLKDSQDLEKLLESWLWFMQ